MLAGLRNVDESLCCRALPEVARVLGPSIPLRRRWEGAVTRLLILGAGPAGLAAAIWADRLGVEAEVLEGEERAGGQLWRIYSPVPDYPGFPHGNGPSLAQGFMAHASLGTSQIHTGTPIIRAHLSHRSVELAGGQIRRGDALLLATGAEVQRLNVPGEDRLSGHGVSWSASRDGKEAAGRTSVVVGGGDSAVENALFLAEWCSRVYLVHRGKTFRARADFMGPALTHPRIHIRTETVLAGIYGRTAVEGVKMLSTQDARETDLPCQAVFIRVGVRPRTELFRGQIPMDDAGYLKVGPDQGVGLPFVYAAGDLCNPTAPSVSAAMGQAMIAVKQVQLAALRGELPPLSPPQR